MTDGEHRHAGAVNVTLNPGFNPNRLLWLENGGIYAQANLRGGAEYGENTGVPSAEV